MEKQGHNSADLKYSDPIYYKNIKRCILEGFFMQVAHLERAGHYLTLRDNQVVLIHPSSVLEHRPEWVLYHEYVLTSKNYIRIVLEVKPEWFFEIETDYFNVSELPECDAKRCLMKIAKRKSAKPKENKEEDGSGEDGEEA